MAPLVITGVSAGSATIHTKHRPTGDLCDIPVTVSAGAVSGTYYPNTANGDYIHTDMRPGGVTDLQALTLTDVNSSRAAWGDGIQDPGFYHITHVNNNVDGSNTRALAQDVRSFASNYITSALTTTGLLSVPITQVTGQLGTNGLPQRIVLGWGTANAEEVLVTAYSGGVATLSNTTPTVYAHPANDPVAIGYELSSQIQTYLTGNGRGAGRKPHHVIARVRRWRGRTATEVGQGLGYGTAGQWQTFNGHIGGGAGDASGHGVTLAGGGNSGRKGCLFLRENFADRDDFLEQGQSASVNGGFNNLENHMGGINYATGAAAYIFGSSSLAKFNPNLRIGEWADDIYEIACETSLGANDGIARWLVDFLDGNGPQLVFENTAAPTGPHYIDSIQLNGDFNSPFYDQTEYFKDVVIYEPADGRTYAPPFMGGNPTFVSHTTGQVTLTITGIPSSGVDAVQFYNVGTPSGNIRGPFTSLGAPITLTAGDLAAGSKTVTLTLTSGQTYDIGYGYGLAGHFNGPYGSYHEIVP